MTTTTKENGDVVNVLSCHKPNITVVVGCPKGDNRNVFLNREVVDPTGVLGEEQERRSQSLIYDLQCGLKNWSVCRNCWEPLSGQI